MTREALDALRRYVDLCSRQERDDREGRHDFLPPSLPGRERDAAWAEFAALALEPEEGGK